MTKQSNIKAIETGSGIAWSEWTEYLEAYKVLPHGEIAKMVLKKIEQEGKSASPEWWAQGVTVAYEQHIGRRKPGQQKDGTFSVTVTKTYAGEMDAVFTWWNEKVSGAKKFKVVNVVGVPRNSQTEKWRYWRAKLDDGTKIIVNIQAKSKTDKSLMSISHDHIKSTTEAEQWRAFWKDFIN